MAEVMAQFPWESDRAFRVRRLQATGLTVEEAIYLARAEAAEARVAELEAALQRIANGELLHDGRAAMREASAVLKGDGAR